MRVNNNYAKTLDNEDDKRLYANKIILCSGTDPYEVDYSQLQSVTVENTPSVSREDLIEYLVLSTNFFTLAQLKCYKSLEAHNFVTSGHVIDVSSFEMNATEVVVFAKVRHSQSANNPPLLPWILMRKAGEVLTAHCTCMAGNGSVCSHVAATLFYLEVLAKRRDSTACTSKENVWLPPSLKTVNPCEVRKSDFTSSRKKWKIALSEAEKRPPKVSKVDYSQCVPSASELNDFLKKLDESKQSCVVFRVMREFHQNHIPKRPSAVQENPALPKPLRIFEPSYRDSGYETIVAKCEEILRSMNISQAEADALEEATRKQADSALWKVHRTGILTASSMKDVCVTSVNDPSLSVIKKICYPNECQFSTVHTERGRRDEKGILLCYENDMKEKHENFQVLSSGLVKNPKYPHLGATPDGISSCTCHGLGLVEVKSVGVDSKENSGVLSGQLDPNHKYRYQVETQMLVTGLPHCDFVVKHPDGKISTERIYPDFALQREIVQKAETFFLKVVLPEMLCKYFTSQRHLLKERNQDVSSFDSPICMCRNPPKPPMINCQNSGCKILTFHRSCVGVSNRIRRWTCSDCTNMKVPKSRKVAGNQLRL